MSKNYRIISISDAPKVAKNLTSVLTRLAHVAYAYDLSGRYADANVITKEMIRLAFLQCMQCGKDSFKGPIKRYTLVSPDENKTEETLCGTCARTVKKTPGWKIVATIHGEGPDPRLKALEREQYSLLNPDRSLHNPQINEVSGYESKAPANWHVFFEDAEGRTQIVDVRAVDPKQAASLAKAFAPGSRVVDVQPDFTEGNVPK